MRGQPPLRGHLPVPRGWLLNGSSTEVQNFQKIPFHGTNEAKGTQETKHKTGTGIRMFPSSLRVVFSR